MKSILAGVLLAVAGTALAQASPVGLWKTIDDETKAAKSYVRVTESGGVLTGKVEKLLAADKQDSRCDKCTDARKDQPVLGMTLFAGAKPSVEDRTVWEGAEILDPTNGKTYKMRLRVTEGGSKLEVRGYVAFFYRNQEWIRVE
jgi:uncharacterized protein (DUF2147 family)